MAGCATAPGTRAAAVAYQPPSAGPAPRPAAWRAAHAMLPASRSHAEDRRRKPRSPSVKPTRAAVSRTHHCASRSLLTHATFGLAPTSRPFMMAFTADFEAYAKENISQSDVVAKLEIDAEAAIGDFRRELVAELQMLGPFGQGNPEPVFATKGVRLACPPRRVGAGGGHLQLTITDGLAAVRCIGFRMGRLEKKLLDNECFNVAYQPQINTYNGNTSVQLVLADIQFE